MLIDQLREVLILNELGGDGDLAYKFSDADGVKSGKSGWSFGVSQFDIANNSMAALCLIECGFSNIEIGALKHQTIDIKRCNMKLHAHKDTIDKWDTKQMRDCLERVKLCADTYGFRFSNNTAVIMAADYHNQFFMSKGGKFCDWAASLARPVTAEDIYRFKLTLPWGLKRKDDVQRRYRNVLKVMTSGVKA